MKSIFVAVALAVIPGAVWAQDSAPAPTPAAPQPAAAPADPAAPAGVVIAMGFPTTVNMDNHGLNDPNRVQAVPVAFSLTNLTDQPITLTSPNECQSHTWKVTDASGAVVDDESMCPEIEQPVSLVVTAGAPMEKQLTINMHVFRYNEGQTYTLTFNYFGLKEQANFQVQFYLGADTAGK